MILNLSDFKLPKDAVLEILRLFSDGIVREINQFRRQGFWQE